jgi:hypothetical protein
MRPGSTTAPEASMISSKPSAAGVRSLGPTAEISAPSTATKPPGNTERLGSTVTT